MSHKTIVRFYLVSISVVLFCILTLVTAPITTLAQVLDPVSQGASVSATMPDIVPPTAPILISPENGSVVSTNRPQFVWLESSDNVAVSHYQLFIDGRLALDNIAPTGSYNLYDLTYDLVEGKYSLRVKFDLEQGQRTWRVVAVDGVGLATSSATWSFLVDSIAPHFVLSQIGEVAVSISAQDSSTIPDEPIKLAANQPLLVARGEANSEVQLTMQIPGRSDHFVIVNIDSSGNWSYRLPILPRDTIITLNLVIVDQARHVSVLEGVRIIIPSEKIVLPRATVTPSPVVTPDPDRPTPHPGEPTPTVPDPDKPVEIPILPPKEIVHEVVRRLTPTPIWEIAHRPWFVRLMRALGPWLVVVVLGWPAALATLLLAGRFSGAGLPSWAQLKHIWQALGLMPWREFEGWVFDADYFGQKKLRDEGGDEGEGEGEEAGGAVGELGVPFAQVTAISQSEPEGFPPFYKQLLTNRQGLYPQLELPHKSYKLAITHPDYRYPSVGTRSHQARVEDFYQAQEVAARLDQPSLSLQIPADNDLIRTLEGGRPAGALNKRHWQKLAWSRLTKLQVWLSRLAAFHHPLLLINIILASSICLFWPSALNLCALTVYILFGFLVLMWSKLFGNISGLVVNQAGDPVPDLLIRLTQIEQLDQDGRPASRGATVATITNQDGRFSFSLKKGHFELLAVPPNNTSLAQLEQDNRLQVNSRREQHQMVLGIKQPDAP